MEAITGYVEHIVFRNEENGYTVLEANVEGEELTCVGSFSSIHEGEFVEASGIYSEHPVYGRQFQVKQYEVKQPEDAESIERYLGSGVIRGIGAALAARIVKRFGDQTFEIMEMEPERLAEIKGISDRKAREISVQVEEKRDMRKAMLFLQKYGISNALAVKIYQQYGQRLYSILEENPYQMADDIAGIGFKIADEIAVRIGIHMDSEFRIQSGILYVLLQSGGEGHVYLPQNILLQRASDLLQIDMEDMTPNLMNLTMEHKVVVKQTPDETRVYAAQYYYLELNTAKMLHDLNISSPVSETELIKIRSRAEDVAEIQLDQLQREAVVEAVKNGVLVITGGPGTGKTTTINTIIRFFEAEHMDICLAAPTGRAAKRMTEATGCEAQTIHRLLEVNAGPGDEELRSNFERNEQNPLDTDVVIIDEMSMVDIHLMNALLRAITVGTRLILVGDVNQLPSVGPGSVLKDIIQSEYFKVVELTKIFRQASQSDIVVNAHKINRGDNIVLDNKSEDFFFLKREDPNVIIRVLLALIQEKLPSYVDADPSEIQVLTPMRKGALGVERLNKMLQEYLNPADSHKQEKVFGENLFREGDKIMQIKNNYQLEWEIRTQFGLLVDRGAGVFNGDMGIIGQINHFSETMTIVFDEGRQVEYSFKQLDELELAYAITIHKSQGSEYPAVLLPILTGPRMLFNRNLLYTAVTRAKKCVTIVGSEAMFHEMVENKSEQKRYSSLKDRIIEVYN